MTRIGKAIDKDDVDMVAKWNDKYGTLIHDKVVPPSTASRRTYGTVRLVF